jgi:ADP-heptose:LPS heptosyltransferase
MRFLIVALDNLGDLVFASALPPAIRSRYPDATIGLWTKAYTAPLAPLMPDVAWAAHADPFWDDAPGHPKGAVTPFLRSIGTVKAGHFDVALLASPQWRVAAAVAAAGIPVRIGQRRNYNRGFLTTTLPAADRGRPVVDDLATLLEPIDARPAGGDPLTTYLDAAPLEPLRESLRQRLASMIPPASGIPAVAIPTVATINPFVTLAPVGIPFDIWIATARLLRDQGYTVVWSGTPTQLRTFHRDYPLEPGWLSAADLTDGSLPSATALLSISNLYLGCDSGPLHLSAALGVPVVGVFPNLTKLPRFAPQGRGPSRIITPPITADTIVAGVDALQRAG